MIYVDKILKVEIFSMLIICSMYMAEDVGFVVIKQIHIQSIPIMKIMQKSFNQDGEYIHPRKNYQKKYFVKN